MTKRRYIDNQTKVKVMVQTYKNELNSFWFTAFAAAIFAVAFYFFSIFFSFSGWRALTEN